MMISMGVGSIVSNVASATFPIRGQPGGWFKSIFLYLGAARGSAIPTGALLLALVAVICHLMLSNTKLGPLHLRHRQQHGGRPPLRRRREEVADAGLRHRRRHGGHRRDLLRGDLHDRPSRPGAGLRAVRHRRGGHRRAPRSREASARSGEPSSAFSSCRCWPRAFRR